MFKLFINFVDSDVSNNLFFNYAALYFLQIFISKNSIPISRMHHFLPTVLQLYQVLAFTRTLFKPETEMKLQETFFKIGENKKSPFKSLYKGIFLPGFFSSYIKLHYCFWNISKKICKQRKFLLSPFIWINHNIAYI